MGLSELQVELACACGKNIAVGAKDAGGSVRCNCGQSIAVTSLSKLRSMVGVDAYVTNPAEAIRKAQHRGIRPAGERCLLCGSTAPTFYLCNAICESSHLKASAAAESNDLPGLLSILFLPRLILLLLKMASKKSSIKEAEVRGHDVEVSFDLPICDPCAATSGNPTRPNVAKQLMQRVELYKDLLAYYPGLRLTIERRAE